MERNEAENKIKEKLTKIHAILKEYAPYGSGHLSLVFIGNYAHFFNKYWDEDGDKPLDCTFTIGANEEKEK